MVFIRGSHKEGALSLTSLKRYRSLVLKSAVKLASVGRARSGRERTVFNWDIDVIAKKLIYINKLTFSSN